jgi:hypothetical protein
MLGDDVGDGLTKHQGKGVYRTHLGLHARLHMQVSLGTDIHGVQRRPYAHLDPR